MAHSDPARFWSAILDEFRHSGLTHVEFCRRRHLSLHAFRYWLYRRPNPLPNRSADATAAMLPAPASTRFPTFLPVHVRPQTTSGTGRSPDRTAAPPLELVLDRDRRIRVPVGFDPDTLHQLLDALETRP